VKKRVGAQSREEGLLDLRIASQGLFVGISKPIASPNHRRYVISARLSASLDWSALNAMSCMSAEWEQDLPKLIT